MNSKHNKSDAFQGATQLLVMTTTEIHMRTEAVRAKTNIKFERCHIKFLQLSIALLFSHSSNHRCKIAEHE